MKILLLLPCLAILAMVIAAQSKPPVAKEIPKVMKNFGDTRVDPYFWIRERENPAVLEYVNAENAYTQEVMSPMQTLTDRVYADMLKRIQQTDMSAPYRNGPYLYYTRQVEGQQYNIYARKKGSLDSPEEILFDVNALAKDKKFFNLDPLGPDPSHKLYLFATDDTGYNEWVMQVKDLSTGKLLSDRVERISDAVWAQDGRHIFYVRQQEKTKRPYQVWRHELGSEASRDTLVYEEKDERFNAGIQLTRSRQYVLITVASGLTSETRYVKADRPLDPFQIVVPRQEGITYRVEHQDKRFLIQINDTNRDFRLVEAPITELSRKSWKEVIPAAKGQYIEATVAFATHLAVIVRNQGLPALRVQNLKTGEWHDAKFDEASYTLDFGTNAEYGLSAVRISYSSPVTPATTYDYDMNAKTKTLVKQQPVPGGYNPADYTVERVSATSSDGTKVPITIIYKKGIKKDGTAPALLYGYGAYAIPNDPRFSSTILALLDRGVIYASSHIRGGTDLGYSWYEDGKLNKKKNTFRDFIACAEYLIAEKYTNRARLGIYGGSAGGLLVGAAVTQRPELFQTVLAAVPFVDVVNSLMDKTIPLSSTDADEFGDPEKQEFYEYLKSYSPYDNTKAAKYPNMYIWGGMNDSQVVYWEPVKWTAQLRKVNQSKNTILLKMNVDAGHGGASGRYDRLKEAAQAFAFFLYTVGIKE
jgi:oligopeptidase B